MGQLVLLAGGGLLAEDHVDRLWPESEYGQAESLDAEVVPRGRLHIQLFQRRTSRSRAGNTGLSVDGWFGRR